MPHTVVRGVQVHYREMGAGPGVVLLHSAGSSSGQWRKLMETLAPRYRVLAPDLLGYGGTGHWPEGRHDLIADEAAIAAAMLDLLDAPGHLVGHSYGGHVALRAALAAPARVHSLVLIEPSMSYLLAHAGESAAYEEVRRVADRVFALAAAGRARDAAQVFVDYWMGEGMFDRMNEERRKTATDNVRKLVYQWPHSLERERPTLADYAGLARPTLLVQGAKTTFSSRRLMGLFRAAFAGHRYAEIAGAGHMSAVTHAEAVNAAIDEHLAHCEQAAIA